MANEKQSTRNLTKKHLARKQREERQAKTILIVTIVIAIAVIGLVAYGLVDNYLVRPNHPIAQVGDQVIKAGEFESRVKYTRVQLLDQAYTYYQYYSMYGEFGASFLTYAQDLAYQMQDSEGLGSQVLDDMIYEIIIREEAAARGITVSDAEVENAMKDAFGFYPDGTATPSVTPTVEATPTYSKTELALVPATSTPTQTQEPTETPEVTATSSEEAAVTEETEATGDAVEGTQEPEGSPTITLTPTITPTPTTYTTEIYGQNLDDFDKMYKDYRFSADQLRSIYEANLLGDKLEEQITADVSPVEEQVWARHILVETEDEAQIVINLLNEGADWTELAAEYSTDETNKNNGGDLGWFNATAMVEPFADAAFAMSKPGSISDPVQTDFGWHIIQFIGKREAQMSATDFQNEKDAVFNNWLEELKNAREDIEIFEDWTEYVPTTPEMPSSLLSAILLGGQ